MFKVLLASVFAFTVIGCDSGGGGSEPAPEPTPQYPNVAGTYAFNTSDIHGACDDGSEGTFTGVAFPFVVTQDSSALTFTNPESGAVAEAAGIDIQDTTGMNGVLTDFDGRFMATQKLWFAIGSDNFYAEYIMDGLFTSEGMSGDYAYAVHPEYGDSCYFTTTFSGSKVTSKEAVKSTPLFENVDVDVYDTHGVIGRLSGL